MKSRRAQEEIVGFAVIVILAAIILIIFLAFYIRNDPVQNTESTDIHQFLQSLMQTTSDCALSYEPNYLKYSDLIQECHQGLTICLSDEDPCDVLEETIPEIIESSFYTNTDANTKGYELEIYYYTNTTQEDIFFLQKGNCSNSAIKGSEVIIPSSPGDISTILKLCS